MTHLDTRIQEYDKHIAHLAREDEQARQLMQLPGIGPTTASAIAATIGKGHDFTSGRQFCAWIGLVPGHTALVASTTWGGSQRMATVTSERS